MRILFLNPGAQLGGAERCLLDLLASLRQAEPQWQLELLTGENGPLLAEARTLGAEAHCLAFPSVLARAGCGGFGLFPLLQVLPALAIYGIKLRRAIARTAPDVIHTNGMKMHLLAAWNGLFAGKSAAPVIWHMHDYISGRSKITQLLRLSSTRCAGTIAISQSVAADIRKHLRPQLPIKTVLNAVDLNRFHPQGPKLDLDRLTGVYLATRTLRVGLVATFARWKGHEVFLRALARPELRGLNIHAYVIGGPIYQTAQSQYSFAGLSDLSRDLGVERRVSFTGFVADPASAMRALDIVVHASTAPEPFGLAIAEAMACGRPLIAAQAGAAAEIFVNGCTAVGVSPGDEAALARAIAVLARDGIARMCLGRAARVAAEVRFNRDRLGPAVAQFYREVLQPCEYSTSTAAISTAA